MGVSGYKEERNQIEIANSKAPPAPINAHNVRSTVWAAGRVVSGTRSGGPRHLQGSVRLAWWYSLHIHGEHTQGPLHPCQALPPTPESAIASGTGTPCLALTARPQSVDKLCTDCFPNQPLNALAKEPCPLHPTTGQRRPALGRILLSCVILEQAKFSKKALGDTRAPRG